MSCIDLNSEWVLSHDKNLYHFLFFQHGPSLGTFWMFYDTGLQLSFHQKFFSNVRVLRKCLMTVEPVIILIIVMIVTNGLWLWILGHIVIARSVDWIWIWFYGIRSKKKFQVFFYFFDCMQRQIVQCQICIC